MRITGDLIRMVRISRKFTQAALAEKAGVTQALISYIENEVKSISLEMEVLFRKILKLDDAIIRKLTNMARRRKKDYERQ